MTHAVHFTKNAEAAAAIMAYYNEAPPRAYVHSFGCQQNVNDGEKILGVLLDAGYGEAASPEEADLIIFNTCAVREHAEQRVFGNVGAPQTAQGAKSPPDDRPCVGAWPSSRRWWKSSK